MDNVSDDPDSVWKLVNDTSRCLMMEKSRYKMDNATTPFYINLGSDYNGIPEVLLLNFIVFTVGIILFTGLRRWVWNYGRIALHRVVSGKELAKDYNVFSHLTRSSSYKRLQVEEDSDVNESPLLDYYDTGLCSWLSILFRLRDVDILRKCGPDSLKYSRFQRMVIIYLCMITAFCLVVILPLNLTGGYLTKDRHKFDATTIGNISPNSEILWVHCLTTVAYLFLCYWIMRRYMISKTFIATHGDSEDTESSAATVMINGLPAGVAGRTDLITRYFNESYPEFEVVSVQFAYDIAALAKVEQKLEVAMAALGKARNSNEDPLIAPHRCGMISCCCRQVRATAYYEQEVGRLRRLQEELKASAEGKPLPFCLVTFAKEEQAQRVIANFDRLSWSNMKEGRGFWAGKSALSHDLSTSKWVVKKAPKATDIKWEHLGIKLRTVRWLFVNLVMFLLLFFLSTPSMVMAVWSNFGRKLNMPQKAENSSFLSHVMPSFLLLASITLLPYIIAAGEEWTYHTTKSGKNLALMTKTFFFMLFMVLIMPSLAIPSGYVFMQSAFEYKYYFFDRWQCIFLPDNGAFFVNFLIATTLCGLTLELLRSAHLAYYIYRMCQVASKFELESARLASIFPFPFGLNYAYMLVMFAVTIVYSVVCPLITPFGLLYFVLKYLVDRYNMYFVYDSNDISPKLHRRAVDFLLSSCLLAQLVLLAFVVFRSEKNGTTYPYMQIAFVIAAFIISFLAYTGHLTMGCLPKWMCDCLQYRSPPGERETRQNQTDQPPVEGVQRATNGVELSTNNVVTAQPTYGSVGPTDRW